MVLSSTEGWRLLGSKATTKKKEKPQHHNKHGHTVYLFSLTLEQVLPNEFLCATVYTHTYIYKYVCFCARSRRCVTYTVCAS